MTRNLDLNNCRIRNPDGISRRRREMNRISPKNERRGFVREHSSRAAREMFRAKERYQRKFRAASKVKRPATTQLQKARKRKRHIQLASSAGAMVGHALTIVAAVAFCAVVYVSSLTIRVHPCTTTAHSIGFQTSFRNPDETPLRAILYRPGERYSKDFVGVAYLLFDELQAKTEYTLSIVNLETEEELYNAIFLTASKDPYRIQVDNPRVTDDGFFEFSLTVEGVPLKNFYSLIVMDRNGKTIFISDDTAEQSFFSIPLPSAQVTDTPDGTGPESGTPGTSSHSAGQSGTPGASSDNSGQEPDTPGEIPDVTEQEPNAPEATEQEPDTPGETPDVTGQEPNATGEQALPALPFVIIKIKGKSYMPRVWEEHLENTAKGTVAPEQDAEPNAVQPEPEPEKVEWEWNEEHTEVEALFPDPENPGETLRVSGEVTETVAKEAGCTEEGLTVYEASVFDENGVEYKDVQTAVIPPTGHHYERVREDNTGNGTLTEYLCTGCGKTYRIDAVITEEPE